MGKNPFRGLSLLFKSRCYISGDILGISDSEDFSAETTNEGGRLIHWRKFWNGDVGGLMHALPVLDLIERKKKPMISFY